MAQFTIQQAFDLALQHHRAGRLREAEQLYRQILAQQPNHLSALHQLGVIAYQVGQLDAAIDLIRRLIALKPDSVEAYTNLGNILREKGLIDEAITACHQALQLNPNYAEAYNNLGNALQAKGLLDEGITAFRKAVELKPDYALAHGNLGCALREMEQTDEAITALRELFDSNPDFAEAHNNLGNALKDKGQFAQAIAAYRQAIALRSKHAQAHNNLSVALRELGQIDQAIAASRQALQIKPDYPEALNNLGNVLRDKWQLDEAVASYRQAIALKPNYPQAYSNLSVALRELGQIDAAVAACRKALELKADYPEALNNLGNALKNKGQLDDAINAYRQAHSLDANWHQALSNLLFTIQYHPGYDAEAIAKEHHQWNHQHGEPLGKFIQAHRNAPDPNHRLKLGYVSADFRSHPVGRFFLPLLQHHDHKQFDIFCYSNGGRADEITAQLRSHADHWREISSLSDEQAAGQIRADGIDILVDLSGHTAGNRLLVFARKPAPVQITSLFTTGLKTMDYRLTDAYLDPSGQEDELYCEQPLRLPNCFWCFEPPGNVPAVNVLPGLSKGYITFGSLNNFVKINPTVLRLWAEVLSAIPGSRMILQCSAGDHQNQVREIFQSAGIVPERVELVPRGGSSQKYFEQYHRVDICLDPTPFSGHTTSFDTLWMGVPLVTLAGRTVVGRSGVSIVSNLGLTELIARTPQEYVSIAVKLAGNLPKLAEIRAGMRQKMLASPLMDAARYARDTEAAYRSIWRAWCEKI